MAFRKIKTTNLTSVETSFSDPVIVLGKDNTSPDDIGFLGKMSVNTYSGFIRDSETSKYYLIDNYVHAIASNDINPVNADKATLVVGTLETEDSFVVASGTTAQRPTSPTAGTMRFNTDTNLFEGYDGTAWQVFIPAQLS